MQPCGHATLGLPDWSSTPPFSSPRLEAVRFTFSLSSLQAAIVRQWVSRISRNCLVIWDLRSQPSHNTSKSTHIAQALPAIIQRLWRTISSRRITPAQAIAVIEDSITQITFVVDRWLTSAPWKVRPQSQHLFVGKPVKSSHRTPKSTGFMNHDRKSADRRLMDPEPKTIRRKTRQTC